MIFIQIASYRDPELAPTIKDCLDKAKHPEQLVFGIAYQHGPEDPLSPVLDTAAFRVLHIPYQESKGACWARKQLQGLYMGEEYTLMLDSHHRFAQDWDQILIDMHTSLGDKSIITTYLPAYDTKTEYKVDCPWRIRFDKITDQGVVSTIPDYMIGVNAPEPAKFFSAHFAFAKGSFIQDIPYDEDLYFLGEETSIAARAFTHGYDMYHPHVLIAWHEYTREGRRKHWDDHEDWWQTDLSSVERYHKMEGMGTERTLEQYEEFIGFSLR